MCIAYDHDRTLGPGGDGAGHRAGGRPLHPPQFTTLHDRSGPRSATRSTSRSTPSITEFVTKRRIPGSVSLEIRRAAASTMRRPCAIRSASAGLGDGAELMGGRTRGRSSRAASGGWPRVRPARVLPRNSVGRHPRRRRRRPGVRSQEGVPSASTRQDQRGKADTVHPPECDDVNRREAALPVPVASRTSYLLGSIRADPGGCPHPAQGFACPHHGVSVPTPSVTVDGPDKAGTLVSGTALPTSHPQHSCQDCGAIRRW